MTATNRDLERAVAEGWFRADLRYRLEVFTVEVPPLRERGDDVFLLTAHFLRERSRALGRKEPRLHPEVITALPKYPFPGNVRELRNLVEQAVLIAEGPELTLADFPVLLRMGDANPAARPVETPPRWSDPGRQRDRGAPAPAPAGTEPRSAQPRLADIRHRHESDEKDAVVAALEASRGNVSAAARALGLSRYQLLRRLAKYGLR
jgi:transcriptional regulator with GAF, ATPase, and Fis domain